MISKLRFSLIAVIMLVLVGFGFQNQANGQVGLNGLFCPAVPDTTGWLETEIVGVPAGKNTPDFTGSLIGTVENSGADVVGGLDWQHVDDTFSYTTNPTNETGSQLVSWWTQKPNRNTYLQVTNSDGPVNVHVRIFNEDCVEIRDFCDFYTPYDTHEYNFGDLFSNGGAKIADGNLQGVEGWLVVTSVSDDCGGPNEYAVDHNYLSGQLIVHDSNDYLYGVNTYARQAVCYDIEGTIPVNRVPDASFGSGSLGTWTQQQNVAAVIDPLVQIAEGQFVPFNDQFSPFAGISIAATLGGSGSGYGGGSFPNLAVPTVVGGPGGPDFNVSILQSGNIPVSQNGSTLSYNAQLYAPDFIAGCHSWTAVMLIRDNGAGNGTVVDARCYQQANFSTLFLGPGTINSVVGGNRPCQLLTTDGEIATALTIYPFLGGRSAFQIGETLSTQGQNGNYRVQVVSGIKAFDPEQDPPVDIFCAVEPVAGLVNGFELIEQQPVIDVCNPNALDGTSNSMLDRITPEVLSGQFNILPDNTEAGADVVHINFKDSYGPPYEPLAAYSSVFVSIFDEDEVDQSCGTADVCFTRLGIDDPVKNSDDFNPATPTPTPTAPPTATPTPTLPPTPTPTPTGNGGSGSCAIAGSPVQLGTALANVLIPLVPVAFAFGVRAVRRRKK